LSRSPHHPRSFSCVVSGPMKSAIACGVSMVAMMTLHGCGSDSTTPDPSSCAPRPDAKYDCPTSFSGNFSDMGDGDDKNVVLADGVVTIKQGSTWNTSFSLDPTSCRGEVNFNVAGKPNPPNPPANLTFAILKSLATEQSCDSPSNYVLSFSAVGDTTYNPLNQWIQPAADGETVQSTGFKCFPVGEIIGTKIFSDMKDGDKKNLAFEGCTASQSTCVLTIKPNGDGNWSLSANVDKSNCSAMIDFSSKDPSAGVLQATFRVSRFHGQPIQVDLTETPLEYFIEFVNPTTGTQVNQWVEARPGPVVTTTIVPATTTTTVAPVVPTTTTVAPVVPTTTTTVAPVVPTTTTTVAPVVPTTTTTVVPVVPVIVA